MVEIRFHGRGGQGTVVATKALADAFLYDGKWVQTFPEYGVERRGAPVQAFVRVSNERLYIRCKIYTPDFVVIMDPTLIDAVNVCLGLKNGGLILINSHNKPNHFNFPSQYKVHTFDATSLALKYGLGAKVAPIVNMPMLGAFAKITKLVSIDSLLRGIREESPTKVEENVKAAEEAYKIAEEGEVWK